VRDATAAVASANWITRIPARRRLARAQQELAQLEASAALTTTRTDVGGLP
jgi:membrane protein